ncbi:hypothetical protein GW916_09935 [bacterium]|nr:hypothetical protein [bacterium]
MARKLRRAQRFNRRSKLEAIADIFKPENWRWSWIAGLLCFLLAVNLFGPKGILHYVLLEQQSSHYQSDIDTIKRESLAIQEKIDRIQHSKMEQEVLVREKLGVLKKGEYRVDFVSAQDETL